MHHQRGKDRQQLFLTSLDQMVEKDSWARLVDLFVDALPIHEMGFTHTRLNKEGNLPYHPADLFKLLLYGYRHAIRSANKLADACKINVEVMWLLKGLRPSARTINYFRANNGEAIEKAHQHFVRLLQEWSLIEGQTVALDGTKIRAQNSLKRNFNARKIRRHLEYIDGKMSDYLAQLDDLDEERPTPKRKRERKELTQKIDQLQARREAYEDLAEQVEASPDGQLSLSDPEARAVILHRNIVEVGYNLQAIIDERYKLVVDIFCAGVNDVGALARGSKRVQQVLKRKFIDLLADAGYHHGAELAYAERRGVRPFVAPRRNPPQKEKGFRKEDFLYNPADDTYRCPAQKLLTPELTFRRISSQRSYRVRRYGTPHCAGCPLKRRCTTSDIGRKIERPLHQAYTDRNDQRVARYKEFYRTRQEIIEHIFGTWKRHWGMTYSLLKGKQKVGTEFRLAALAYNLLRTRTILGIDDLRKRLQALLALILPYLRAILGLPAPSFFQKTLFSFEIYRAVSDASFRLKIAA
ncbi:MAG: IS1182 family transposase [Saprospiraceae bacterium]|nr:IS1182 family transposase [Saprospiraceae bacterium]MCB0683783.1 IS1182 family transposase [Saprospiraceae bacterium]